MKELGLLITGMVAGTIICNCLKNNRPCPRPCSHPCPPPERPCDKRSCHGEGKRRECPCKMVPFYDGRY